jgi:hypothetical protein
MGDAVTREEALSGGARVLERVETPEWGEGRHVYVRSLTAGELMDLVPSAVKREAESLAATVAATACDSQGVLLFGPEDVPRLAGQRASVLLRINRVANRLNGAGDGEDGAGKGSPATA